MTTKSCFYHLENMLGCPSEGLDNWLGDLHSYTAPHHFDAAGITHIRYSPAMVRVVEGESFCRVSSENAAQSPDLLNDLRRRSEPFFLQERYEGRGQSGDRGREGLREARRERDDRCLCSEKQETGGRREAVTMADDDLDLDAMLDSALDEGFADPAAAQAGGEDDGDLDLDAMLDEAMVASVLDEGSSAAAAEKSRYLVARFC